VTEPSVPEHVIEDTSASLPAYTRDQRPIRWSRQLEHALVAMERQRVLDLFANADHAIHWWRGRRRRRWNSRSLRRRRESPTAFRARGGETQDAEQSRDAHQNRPQAGMSFPRVSG